MIKISERLLDLAYALPSDSQITGLLLDEVMQLTDASMGHVFTQDQATGYVRVDTRAPAGWVAEYQVRFGADNPIEARMLGKVHSGLTCRLHDFLPMRDYEAMEIYQDMFVPLNMHWGIGTHVEATSQRQTVLTINRSRGQRDFGASHLALLDALCPHLRRAFRLSQALDEARGEVSALQQGLDQFQVAVAELDNTLRVHAVNAAMDAWLRQGEAAVTQCGHLTLTDAVAHAQLQVTAGRLASRLAPSNQAPIEIRFGHGNPRGRLLCLPKPLAIGTGQRFLVFLRGEESGADAQKRLRCEFGLTEAQSALALALARRETLSGYAERQNVSMTTVKTHLQELFQKTGTRRQAELVLVLARVCSGV